MALSTKSFAGEQPVQDEKTKRDNLMMKYHAEHGSFPTEDQLRKMLEDEHDQEDKPDVKAEKNSNKKKGLFK